MKTLFARLLAMILVVPAIYCFVYWVPCSFVPLGEQRWIANIIALVVALGVGGYVWSKISTAHNSAILSAFIGAVLLGSIGFTAGFFGPMIITPEANQGPLLGILITGPLGFVAGGVVGFLYWRHRSRNQPRQIAI